MPTTKCVCGEELHYSADHGGKGARCRCGRMVLLPTIAVQRRATQPPKSRWKAEGHGRSWRDDLRWKPLIGVLAMIVIVVIVTSFFNRSTAASKLSLPSDSISTPPVSPLVYGLEPSGNPVSAEATQPPETVSRESDRSSDACPAPDSSADWRSVRSGFEPIERKESGLGSLTVRNGSDGDALVRLTVVGNDEPSRELFVRRSGIAALRHIGAGNYIVSFETGRTYLRQSEEFCDSDGEFEFDKQVTFDERKTRKATLYHDYDITLYTVPGGNVGFHRTSAPKRGRRPNVGNP